MLIANWMTHDPVSVLPTTSLAKCQKLLKTHHIRRLPVVDSDNHLVGIISDRDVKSASPSKATSLEIHEMQYLLAEVKARDIMTVAPLTVQEHESVVSAAMLMLDKKIGGLPVVDEDMHLVGIITDQDIFKLLVTICGARLGGIDITIETGTDQGSLGIVLDVIRQHRGRIISVLSAYLDNGRRQVFLRMHSLPEAKDNEALKEALRNVTTLVEWTESEPTPEPTK